MEEKIEIKTSRRWLLNLRDLARSAGVYAGTSFATLVYKWIDAGTFPGEKELIASAKISLLGTAGYLLKKWLEPSSTVIKIKPPVTDEKETSTN